jgi:hypothetical protein
MFPYLKDTNSGAILQEHIFIDNKNIFIVIHYAIRKSYLYYSFFYSVRKELVINKNQIGFCQFEGKMVGQKP